MIEAASEQPASEVGDQDGLLRAQDLGRLGHEVDAGQDDHVGVGLRALLGERQRVAGDVGDAVEDLRRLVVVGEDDGVALPLQLADRVDVRGVDRPLHVRDDLANPLANGGGGVRDVGSEVEDRQAVHFYLPMLTVSISSS